MSQESGDSMNYFDEKPKWFEERVNPPTQLWAQHFSLPKEQRNELFDRVFREECKVLHIVYPALTKSQVTEKAFTKFGIPTKRGRVLKTFIDDYNKSQMSKTNDEKLETTDEKQETPAEKQNTTVDNILKRKNEDSETDGVQKKRKRQVNIHARIANLQQHRKCGTLSVKDVLRDCRKFRGKKYEEAMVYNKFLLGDYSNVKSSPTSQGVTGKSGNGERSTASSMESDSESSETDDEFSIHSQLARLAQERKPPIIVPDSDDEIVDYSQDIFATTPESETLNVLDEDCFSSDSFDSQEFSRRFTCNHYDQKNAQKELGNILLTGSDSESLHSSDIVESSQP